MRASVRASYKPRSKISFFDEAKALHKQEVNANIIKTAAGMDISMRVIDTQLAGITDTMYSEICTEAMNIYRRNGEIQHLSYMYSEALSSLIKSCEPEIIKTHIEASIRLAFDKLNICKLYRQYSL